jgi:hypothetical protein
MGIAGTWNVTLNSPMGAQQATLELAEDGGKLSGQMKSPQGAIDITEGSVDGNAAKWKAEMTQPMAMTLEFAATVDGDKIDGTVSLGSFGNATFNGTRA